MHKARGLSPGNTHTHTYTFIHSVCLSVIDIKLVHTDSYEGGKLEEICINEVVYCFIFAVVYSSKIRLER